MKAEVIDVPFVVLTYILGGGAWNRGSVGLATICTECNRHATSETLIFNNQFPNPLSFNSPEPCHPHYLGNRPGTAPSTQHGLALRVPVPL